VLAPARRRADFASARAAGAASALLWQLPLLRPRARGNRQPAARLAWEHALQNESGRPILGAAVQASGLAVLRDLDDPRRSLRV
jgi:hypothetical protein